MTIELKRFIEKQLRLGTSSYSIYEQCLKRGWNHFIIKAMFNEIKADKFKRRNRLKLFFAFGIIISAIISSLFLSGTITGFFVLNEESLSPEIKTQEIIMNSEIEFGSTGAGIIYLYPISDVNVYEGFSTSVTIYANSTQTELISFYGTDANPNWLTVSGQQTGGPGVNAQGSIEIDAPEDEVGSYPAIIALASGNDSEDVDAQAFTVNVLENTPPSFDLNISNYTWPEDISNTSLNLSNHFSDAEDHSLTFTAQSGGANFSRITFSISDAIVNMTPEADWYGSAFVQFQADDSVDTNVSNIIMLTVTNVPDAPVIENISISPSTVRARDNVSCLFNVTDTDNSSVFAEVSWYFENETGWNFFSNTSLECNTSTICISNDSLSSQNTSIDEVWNCSVTVNDSEFSASSSVNFTVVNAYPTFNISDNSNSDSKLNVGENLTITVQWTDEDGDNVSVYICNSSSISVSGCASSLNLICENINDSETGEFNCTKTINETDLISLSKSYYVAACDEASCASSLEGTYYINHAPSFINGSRAISPSQNTTTCLGNCGTGDNHELYLKYNISSINDSVDIKFNHSLLQFEVTDIIGNWSEIVKVYTITNDSWTGSSTLNELENLTNSFLNSTENITSAQIYSHNVSSPIFSTCRTWRDSNGTNDDELVSFKLTANDSQIKDNASQLSSLVIGNVNNLNGNNGSISIRNTLLNISYYHSLNDLTWNMNMESPSINLNNYFTDIDGDDLTFSASGNNYVDIEIDAEGDVTIDVPINWYGIDTVVFSATDENDQTTDMDQITLTINYVSGVSVVVPSSGGGGSSRTEIASLDLTIPSVFMSSTDEIEVPFELYNSGEIDLTGINLSTFFDVEGLTITFAEDTFLSGLAVAQTYNSSITLKTQNVPYGNYSVEFIAAVTNPRLTQSSSIYITIEQKDFTEMSIEKQIKFAEDLFKQNPECLELLEVLARVQQEINKHREDLARELVKDAVDDCKELISSEDEIEKMSFTAFLVDNYVIILIIIGIMVIIYIISLVLLRK